MPACMTRPEEAGDPIGNYRLLHESVRAAAVSSIFPSKSRPYVAMSR